jgi:hypothetical protein
MVIFYINGNLKCSNLKTPGFLYYAIIFQRTLDARFVITARISTDNLKYKYNLITCRNQGKNFCI